MKRIISFSLWGDNPKYINGAKANIELADQYFPEWTCRFYVPENYNDDIVSELETLGAETVFVDEDIIEQPEKGIKSGWFWRFKILDDPSVDVAMIRDTDCRLSVPEKYIVDEWLKSGMEFHIIRNHRMHGVPILAGLWGYTKEFKSKLPGSYEEMKKEWDPVPKHQRYGGVDQQFLAEKIYPLLDLSKTMIHDSHHHYKHESARPIYNTPFSDFFIGKDHQ